MKFRIVQVKNKKEEKALGLYCDAYNITFPKKNKEDTGVYPVFYIRVNPKMFMYETDGKFINQLLNKKKGQYEMMNRELSYAI